MSYLPESKMDGKLHTREELETMMKDTVDAREPYYIGALAEQLRQKAAVAKVCSRVTPAMIGIGGGPTRATTLPEDGALRKRFPLATGVLDYFPDALVAVAELSFIANEQHNPGQPVHWARGKSTDHDDTLMRHFVQRGTIDTDKVRHRTKVAWRALAALQEEIEEAQKQESAA